MQADLLAGLEKADSPARIKHALSLIEDGLTPAELKAALPFFRSLGEPARRACEGSDVLRMLTWAEPQPYVRRDIAADVAFYAGTDRDRGGRDLIVAFCGRSQRLMTCWSLFVQMLPAARFDVLIIADRSNAHFLNGIRGYADTLYGLTTRLAADAEMQRYRRVYCFGTSIGGFPALRGGILLKAFRAISVGGRPVWHVYRLIDPREHVAPAFDVMCDCMPRTGCQLVCVYAEGSRLDAIDAARLPRALRVTRVPIPGIAAHNVVHELYKLGRLPLLYSRLFDFPLGPANPLAPRRL